MEAVALTRLREQHLLAVIRSSSTAAALASAEAVAKGGISLIEVTFTVPAAPSVISELAGREGIMVGAGTVLTAAQARDAISAGAKFIVAPNFSPEIAQITLTAGLMYVPGAYTTTEILAAHAAGAHVIKVYPVGIAGGPPYIHTIREPLPHVPLLAAGGTTLENTIAFLRAGCLGVGLGAALADPKLAESAKFDEITKRAKMFTHRITEARAAGTLPKGV
jgi:2-dehydro-3-deoxyphosphogluconate aldolase / (4S)-4-hydroxy-2-oxoglutarate aldolase